MKFIVLVKANKESENGQLPSDAELAEMGKFNEEMAKAGIMLDGAGLKPSKDGTRISYSGKSRTILDGPFPETKELVAGYWVLECRTKEECVEWMKRAPFGEGALVEIRPFFSIEDFTMSQETRALHDRVAAQVQVQKQSH